MLKAGIEITFSNRDSGFPRFPLNISISITFAVAFFPYKIVWGPERLENKVNN